MQFIKKSYFKKNHFKLTFKFDNIKNHLNSHYDYEIKLL